MLDKGNVPKKRMQHAAACMGGIMLLMGGFSTEAKVILDDYNLFDFQSESWLKVRTTKATDGKVFSATSLNFALKDEVAILDADTPSGRKLHKICSVWDESFYLKSYDK